MINGVSYIPDFLSQQKTIFAYLKDNANWDSRMTARKTASYGVAYNYSQMSYPYCDMPAVLKQICANVNDVIGFEPNNCLINYYLGGNSKMGFHSDQIDILEKDTGVVIVSLGTIRTIRFRNIKDNSLLHDIDLLPGSILYMARDVQHEWQHAIPKANIEDARISLTLRKIK